MSGWTLGLVMVGALLVFAALLTLAAEYFLGSGVHAEYPHGVSFTGGGHFHRLTYYGVAWIRDPQGPPACPLVVHLAAGDVTAAELADARALEARGWTRVQGGDPPGLPLLLEYREGDYAAHVTYANPDGGAVNAVTVGVTGMGSARPEARGIAVTFQGQRLALPAAEQNLLSQLGPPLRRTRGAAY